MALHTGGPAATREPTDSLGTPAPLLAQRTLFAAPTPAAPDALYVAVTEGAVERERHRLTVLPHALATTNTYFGRFPASYWQRWTSATAVDLQAVVTGSGLLRVMASDSSGRPRPVAAQRVDGADGGPVTLTCAIDRFLDGGALWLEVETAAEALTVERVRWSVTTTRPRRPTAVVICTYNRVDDCLATLGTLAADPEVASGLAAVYVVDQGTDTLDSRDTFPALREALGTTLHHIRQPNLGGAGGFTRGMYEALREAADGPVNVLLMDDDIRLEPDTVVRLRALADRSEEPILVGGQMLNLLHPDRLHVGAETADLANLRAGQPVEDAFTDADLTERQQEVRVDAGYNAWWTCLIPSEAVDAVGYPLPVFFQWDDIEFGLRAGEAGFPTVTLPGAGVWHADFAWKNWDDWSRYFSFRNALITSALHSEFDRRSIAGYLAKQLGSYLLSMRYGLAGLLIRAVEDFLRGPDVLEDGGGQVAPAVRKLWADHPETRNHPPTAVPGIPSGDLRKLPHGGTPTKPRAVLGKRIVWQVLGKQRPIAAISSADASWWHVSLFQTAVVTDPSQEGVRVRRFDRDLAAQLARQGAAVIWRLHREGGRVQQQYRDRLPELTSRANWARLFGTDEAQPAAHA